MNNIYGIDFSGAADAGKHIWLARTSDESGHLTVCEVFAASSLTGSSKARNDAFQALRSWIAAQTTAIIGMDFPFSLHRSQIGHAHWDAFALTFGERFPTPEAFYQAAGGHGRELRRETDTASRTPFAPGNLRLYRQTYFGIRDLLAPLVSLDAAVIFPMQEPTDNRPILIEVCPAVFLARHHLRLVRYKGRNGFSRQQRQQIIAGLSLLGVTIPSAIGRTLVDEASGDALDSVIAAIGTATALREGMLGRAYSSVERLEGVVYP